MKTQKEIKRREELEDVQSYISRLKYALDNDATSVKLIEKRRVDDQRNPRFTNSYTLASLYSDDDYVKCIKTELRSLKVENYIETVKDLRFPNKSEMRVFGKIIQTEDVYIKIRVELLSLIQASGGNHVLIMSFHFAEKKFSEEDFPYRRKGD